MYAIPEKKKNPMSSRAKFKWMINARKRRTILCGVHKGIRPMMPPKTKPRLSC